MTSINIIWVDSYSMIIVYNCLYYVLSLLKKQILYLRNILFAKHYEASDYVWIQRVGGH